MRVTHQMILHNALSGLFSNLRALHQAQQEMATGKRINRLSDQPLDASVIMKLDSQLRGLEIYRRADAAAQTRLSAEDAVLKTVDELLGQAKSLASGTASSSDDPLRKAAVEEVRTVRDQIVSLGNTVVSGEYIFGGRKTDTPPFQADGTYVGGDEPKVADLGEGLTVEVNHTGDKLFNRALAALDRLEQELESGTSESIRAAVEDLTEAQRNLREARGEVGSRMQHVAEAKELLTSRSQSLLDQKQELQEADPTESALKLTEAQAALERAYAAVAKVLSTNILQFMR